MRCWGFFVEGESMDKDEYMEDVHVRILRAEEDLRARQRELNCAAMQVPVGPELMEALNERPETEALEVLKSALDQMRHVLWFYMQVMTNESEIGEKLRQTSNQKPSEDVRFKQDSTLVDRFKFATDVMMLRYLADGKNRKPN